MSIHHIDVVFRKGLGDVEWRCTGFYGWPEVNNHHLSWSLLSLLASQSSLPWLCFGDFNEIFFMSKKQGGNQVMSLLMIMAGSLMIIFNADWTVR